MTITPSELRACADTLETGTVVANASLTNNHRAAADTIEALTAQVEEAKGTIEVLLGEARPAEEVLSSAQRYSDSLAEVARLTAENIRLKARCIDCGGSALLVELGEEPG